ncbi:Uncharacterized protein PCOAH_00043430 [Plasmodium coatneyi]|uniref:Uncharacterized protein n=1 Tax=Plasmodium coatneyi TaxID=208452 RepID=A0A1B1E660_9APIC|nr:Uncharacterized protein PCOAH_00043430 [Plasmodium coatneyi]ANQ10249.1 Uncharacterized protein PCOAH_00043430 [Plasmodium coatneyi]
MSGWLLNLLANTKFHIDRARVAFVFLSNLLLINIPLKNVQVKNISFKFDFIKRIITFFSKKKKKQKKATTWRKKEIHVESLSCTLDWREYEEHNLDHNVYARLLHESLEKRIIHSIWIKLLRLFLDAIFKHYFLRVGKLCVKIRYRHAHTHGEVCGGGHTCQTNRRTTYHLILCDVCLFLDHYGGTTNWQVGENQHKQATPGKWKDHLSAPPPSHLRCRKIYLRKENERTNIILVKNVFFFVNEKRAFVSMLHLNGQACELKEIFHRWIRRQPGDHFVKDLIKVLLQRNSVNPPLWSFLQEKLPIISSPFVAPIGPNLGSTFTAEFFSNFFFLLDSLIVELHLGGDAEVHTRGRKLLFETPLEKVDSSICINPLEMFSLSVKSLLTWTDKNVICINVKKADKLLCDVPMEDDLDKWQDKYNVEDIEAVRCKTFPSSRSRHRENFLLREGSNRYRLSLDNSCVIIHLEELLTLQRRLTCLFGLGLWLGLGVGHGEEKFTGRIASPSEDTPHRGNFITEEVLMSLFNFTIYVNKNLSKSLLLKRYPLGKPREEELPYGMCAQQGKEGILKLEVQEVTNHAVRDDPCGNNQGGTVNTDEEEHTHTGRTREGSPHFHLNKVILKWVYYQQGVLYEYAISDPMDVILKREERQDGGRLSPVTIAYVGMSTWYLLPEHIIFVHDLYLLYCQQGRKNRFPLRSKLIRRNKRRRYDTMRRVTHSSSYIILTLKKCQIHLFCISRNFDIYWRVCRYIGHGDVKPPMETRGDAKETPPLASICTNFNLVYLLNITSTGECSSKQSSRTCCSHFYLSNVGIQVSELQNRLSQVCIFKTDKVTNSKIQSQRGISEQPRQPNNRYDVVIRMRGKKVHVDMRNIAQVTFCSFVMYELYASVIRMVNGVDWGGGLSSQPWGLSQGESLANLAAEPGAETNSSLHTWMKKRRYKRRVYHFVRRGRNTPPMSESYHGENSPKECDCQDEGESPKQSIPLHQKSVKKVIHSLRNKRNLLKYELQIDLKSQVVFVSADQVYSLHELQKITNEELKRNEHTLCLTGRLSLLYFDPLQRENIKRCKFMQLHLDAHQVKVRKRTHSNKTFKLFHFEKKLSQRGGPPIPGVFSPSFYNIFRAAKRSHPWGGRSGRYFIVESTVRNVDEVMHKVVNKWIDDVVDDVTNDMVEDRPPGGTRKYNSETVIRGRGLRMIYKTNDFFFFLNKYLLTDACYLFSAKRAVEEAAQNPEEVDTEQYMHNESEYLYFPEAEVADPFTLRNSLSRKRQIKIGIPKTEKMQVRTIGEHYPGYRVKRSELKTLPISLNKHQLVLNKVILFLPSMTNNRNFLVTQSDVIVRNHIELKKKKKIEILDKTHVYFLNMQMHSMDGSVITRNLNMMIMHMRSVLSRLPKPFTLSVHVSGVVRISPRSYKLLQDIFLENVLGNHFEHVQGRHYKGKAPPDGKKLNGEVPSINGVSTNKGRRVKDLDVRLHFLHMQVELQNDSLNSRMNYLFGKFVFARTVRYLGEENIVTYVKGIVPLVMNTFYEYPYDILMHHRKLNPRKYAKWLARMNQSDVEHNEHSFNYLLRTKLRKYARVKKKERKTFHLVYNRVRRDQLGCDVTNHVDVKIDRIYLNTDPLQLFNLYTFYFVDDRNVHLSRVEKLFHREGCAKLFGKAPPSDEQFAQRGHSAHMWLPHQTSMENLKLESIKNAPPEEPLDRRILKTYQRMVKKLTSSDFSNYNSVIRSNNVYTVRVQMRHAHFSFNFLFYQNVLGVRRMPLGGRKQPEDGQSYPFGLTYKGSLDFRSSFNLRKSIFQKFAKKEKYIFFNHYVVDNFLQNRLNKSGELANLVLHTVDHIGDEMDEHIYFNCNIGRKNYLYLTNREGSYCISRNINLCVSARNEKVIYFSNDEKSVKMGGLHYREVFLDKSFGSSPFGGEDEKSAKEKKIICDVQLLDHNGVDIRKGNPNGGASTKSERKEDSPGWEEHKVVEPKGAPQREVNFTPPPSISVDVVKSYEHMESPCAKPKYIDVQVKQANVVIKLADLLYLGSKLHDLLYIMNRHEEVNVCLFRLSEASSKKKDRHKCKIKRMKLISYSTFIVRVILSSLDLHLFENVYYTKLKKCKKSKISHVHVQANYEYLTCHKKNETLFKRHQCDLSLQINFAKNNIYEEFTRGIHLKVICVRTRNQSNLIVILDEEGVNIFLTKNAFRGLLRLYEEANDWRNYRSREVAHGGCYTDEGAEHITDGERVGRCSVNLRCDPHNEESRAQSRRIQRSRRNYEEGGGTHNCADGEDKGGGSTFVRRRSPKLRALLRSKHFNFPHDDYTVVNRTYERVATYRSSEISHFPFDRSNPVHMLYVRRMESFVFPSLMSKWSASGEIVLSCENSFYVVSSTVCIYNDTNHDMVLLTNNQRILLFAKRPTYRSTHRCNIKRDHFMLVLFYKKSLFISGKLSLHDLKSANIMGKEKLHQFMEHKKYFSCRLSPDRRGNDLLCGASVKVVPLRRVRDSAHFFRPDEGRNCANGGGDSDSSGPSKHLTNQYSIYNRIRRKFAKMILNDEWLYHNFNSHDDCIFTNLTVIQNNKTNDGLLYIHIAQMTKMRNTLPIRVHYRSGNTACSVKAFSSKEIFSTDLDLNVSCNTLKGSRMKITYEKRLGFSPVGDPCASTTANHHPQNNDPKEEHTKGEFPPQRSSSKQHHEDVTHYYVNVIKWNNEIIVTCHTLICLYADELKNVEVNRKRIYFVRSSGGVCNTSKCSESILSSPLTFPLKRLNLYVGTFNEPVSSIHMGSYKNSNIPINSFKEVNISVTQGGRECSSYYAVEYKKNCSPGNHSRYSRVSSLLVIYPRFVMLNQTNFNVVMSSSCSSDSMVYTFERRSRSVINLLESEKRSFFFQIGKSNISNDYVFMSGGLDITKEGSYILCFTKGGSSSNSLNNLPQKGDKNHLHKSGKSEKIKTQFVHLKIKIIEGRKLKEESGIHWGSNCLFIIISNHRTEKKKLKKYLTRINSPNVLMHSMESNEKENTLMNIYHFIKEEEKVKKLYVYNDMDIDLMFDVFHFSEFVHMIRKVLEEENNACTAHKEGNEPPYEQKGTVNRSTSQGRHNRTKESFFRNIFLVESSENSSADELIQKEQNANYDTTKLTRQNVSYISNHVNQLKKFVQVNLRQLRRIRRKSIRLFPLRKNKNVKNSFLVIYPWRNAKTYQIVKFSLKRKKHVLTFSRSCQSGNPPDPPLVIILETFILSKKGKKKILVKISQHVDNIVHIRGKVNMSTFFNPGVGTPPRVLMNSGENTAVVKPMPDLHNLERVTKRGCDPYRSLTTEQINLLKKYATVVGTSNRGAYPKRLHTKLQPLQGPTFVRRQLKKREDNAAPPTYCHFKNKNVTFVESRNKYKFIFTKREKGTPKGGLHFYVSIPKGIRINVFSTVLVEGDGEGKLSLQTGQTRHKDQVILEAPPNDERLRTMAHSSQRNLFKKKKNSHLCTLMLRNTNMLVGLHRNNQPNVVLFSLGDATIMEFASSDMKKVLCKYDVKGGPHNNEGDMTRTMSEDVHTEHLTSSNRLACLHMEYEIHPSEWNIKKFELAISPVHVQVTLNMVENFAYCYEKFWRGTTRRSRKVAKDVFQFYFSTTCSNASGENDPPFSSPFHVGLPRSRNSFVDPNRPINHRSIYSNLLEGKKKKLKIGNFQVSSLSIHLSFQKENACSIYQYKNKGPSKLAIRFTYLNDLDDADVTMSPLCLSKVNEKEVQNFLNYLFDFYMKELYKGLFFYLTRMNLVNKYISDYYSFFHVLMDSSIFNVDLSAGLNPVSGVGPVRGVSGTPPNGENSQMQNRRNRNNTAGRRHTSLTNECLRGRKKDETHFHVEPHRKIVSDSNFYIRTKKRDVLKKLNRDLFYGRKEKRMSLFEENAESNCIAVESSYGGSEEKESAQVAHPNNFSLLNNTLKTLGKDIMSSINYYLYDAANVGAATLSRATLSTAGVQREKSQQPNGATFFKTEKMHIMRHFLENRSNPPTGGEMPTKTDEEFSTYLSLYRRNKIVHDEYVPRVCSAMDHHLVRNLVVLDYLHDKQERNLLLFCDEYLVMFHRNSRTIVRKQNIVKVEITCVHFNFTFDRDKSLIINLRHIIRKNKDNFLGFYFDVLFKRKKKRLLQKIKKKLNRIVYFLYYIFYFIHNYQRKVKGLKGSRDPPTRKNVNSFVTIFEGHQKVFFSVSSLVHLARFYFNMRCLLFHMCQPSS